MKKDMACIFLRRGSLRQLINNKGHTMVRRLKNAALEPRLIFSPSTALESLLANDGIRVGIFLSLVGENAANTDAVIAL